LAVAVVVPTSFGQQTSDDLASQMAAMKARMDRLEAENVQLKEAVGSQDDAALEARINALSERFAGTTVNSAANPVTLSGEFRFRGGLSLGKAAAGNFILFGDQEHDGSWGDARIRLGFQYDFSKDVTAFAELQSHFAYGANPYTNTLSGIVGGGQGLVATFAGATTRDDFALPNNGVSLYQGWLETRGMFGAPELSAKTGRQEIVLGNQFIFGNADWYNGTTFDGTHWKWESDSFDLHLIGVMLSTLDFDGNQRSSWLGSHDNDQLYSLYFTLKSIENVEIDLYWVYINGHGGLGQNGLPYNVGAAAQFLSRVFFHTFGARVGGNFGDSGFDFNLEAAFQTGNAKFPLGLLPGNAAKFKGWAVEGEVVFTFDKDNAFRVYVRGLWAKGPKASALPGGNLGWTNLYPNRHSNGGFRARYGIFDAIPMTNVFTLQGGVSFDPAQDFTLGATVLWAQSQVNPGPGISKTYGWEIDAWGEYRHSKNLTFGAGIAFLFPKKTGLGAGAWGTTTGTQFLAYLQARLVF
jgi:hypothetical protein